MYCMTEHELDPFISLEQAATKITEIVSTF